MAKYLTKFPNHFLIAVPGSRGKYTGRWLKGKRQTRSTWVLHIKFDSATSWTRGIGRNFLSDYIKRLGDLSGLTPSILPPFLPSSYPFLSLPPRPAFTFLPPLPSTIPFLPHYTLPRTLSSSPIYPSFLVPSLLSLPCPLSIHPCPPPPSPPIKTHG